MQNEKRGIQIGKSVCVSVLFTLAAVLIFALLIKWFLLSSKVIVIVNQIIKLLSIAIGCALCIRCKKPVVIGALTGLITAVVTYFLFSAIAGSISFGWGNFLDGLFGAVAGAVGSAAGALVRGGEE